MSKRIAFTLGICAYGSQLAYAYELTASCTLAKFTCHPFTNSDLLNLILQYLELPDIARFDTAICDKNFRKIFLHNLAMYVYDGNKNTTYSNCYFQWLFSRKIRIYSLTCNNKQFHLLLHENKNSSVNILEYLEYIDLSTCSYIVDSLILKLLEYTKKLKSVNVSRLITISDLSLRYLADNCEKLETLNVQNCLYITLGGIDYVKNKFPNIRFIKK